MRRFVLALGALLLWPPSSAAARDQAAPAPAAPPAAVPAPPAPPRVSVSPLAAGLDQIERHFLQPIPRVQLEARALAALLRELDPYSRYLDPAELALQLAELDGGFGGIGVTLAFDETQGYPVIEHLLHGGVAARAGIRRGDLLLAVDGASMKAAEFRRVSAALRGPAGTRLRLQLRRAGEAAPIELELERVVIATPSVRALRRDASGRPDWWLDRERRLGYVLISNLSRDTARDLEAALVELSQGQARGLVLDLRDCSGGLMNGAIEAADLLIDRGRLVNIVHRGADEAFEAKPGKYTQLPLVVLVNAGTVSSGEILAGALKDNGRATLVGERTFGKGRIQVLFDLGGGRGGVNISSGTFQRPNGKTIDRHDAATGGGEAGIAPDIEVKMSEAQHAAWLAFAEKTTGTLMLTSEERQGPPPDPVLAKAVELLSKR